MVPHVISGRWREEGVLHDECRLHRPLTVRISHVHGAMCDRSMAALHRRDADPSASHWMLLRNTPGQSDRVTGELVIAAGPDI